MEINITARNYEGYSTDLWIRPSWGGYEETHPIELRIGDPASTGSRFAFLSVSETYQLGHLLLAAAEEARRGHHHD